MLGTIIDIFILVSFSNVAQLSQPRKFTDLFQWCSCRIVLRESIGMRNGETHCTTLLSSSICNPTFPTTDSTPPHVPHLIRNHPKKYTQKKIPKNLDYIQVVPGRAGGGSFRRKKNYIAKKEFAYRMCARRPTSAMPQPCL